jgi:hypothetical protein
MFFVFRSGEVSQTVAGNGVHFKRTVEAFIYKSIGGTVTDICP